jgi:hypothetical protein
VEKILKNLGVKCNFANNWVFRPGEFQAENESELKYYKANLRLGILLYVKQEEMQFQMRQREYCMPFGYLQVFLILLETNLTLKEKD